jgi:hypothetical protein
MEPGRDGVGDYTRILSNELLGLGLKVMILAVKDRYVQDVAMEFALENGHQLSIMRIPSSFGIRAAFDAAFDRIQLFSPHWISLQYVPYAFNSQGIPMSLSGNLARVYPSAAIHIMVHEGYLGGKLGVKNKLIRLAQISVLKRLARLRNTKLVQTTNEAYRIYLENIGIQANVLGLFGNIPVLLNRHHKGVHSKMILKAVYFGASPKHSDFKKIVDKIAHFLITSSFQIEILFCGKAGSDRKEFMSALHAGCGSGKLIMSDLGILKKEEISDLLFAVDFGIARVKPKILGKSGTAISMLEHGLHLFVPLAESDEEIHRTFYFRTSQCFSSLESLAMSQLKFEAKSRSKEIAQELYKSFRSKL